MQVTYDQRIDNDITIPILCKMAVAQARAGADVVAPSDMMDGRIGMIKKLFISLGWEIPVMSYSVKFASNMYGPFRDICNSAP